VRFGKYQGQTSCPEPKAAGLFHALIDHPNITRSIMLQLRGRRADSKVTVIVVRLNIALCLFGIAAIITACLG